MHPIWTGGRIFRNISPIDWQSAVSTQQSHSTVRPFQEDDHSLFVCLVGSLRFQGSRIKELWGCGPRPWAPCCPFLRTLYMPVSFHDFKSWKRNANDSIHLTYQLHMEYVLSPSCQPQYRNMLIIMRSRNLAGILLGMGSCTTSQHSFALCYPSFLLLLLNRNPEVDISPHMTIGELLGNYWRARRKSRRDNVDPP